MEDKILTEKEIDQKIEDATFVASKTIVDMFGEMKEELKEDLSVVVREAAKQEIKVTVNGKIDRIAETLKQQDILQAEHTKKLDELKPILENHRDREGMKRYLTPYMKQIVTIAAVIGALIYIKDFIK